MQTQTNKISERICRECKKNGQGTFWIRKPADKQILIQAIEEAKKFKALARFDERLNWKDYADIQITFKAI